MSFLFVATHKALQHIHFLLRFSLIPHQQATGSFIYNGKLSIQKRSWLNVSLSVDPEISREPYLHSAPLVHSGGLMWDKTCQQAFLHNVRMLQPRSHGSFLCKTHPWADVHVAHCFCILVWISGQLQIFCFIWHFYFYLSTCRKPQRETTGFIIRKVLWPSSKRKLHFDNIQPQSMTWNNLETGPLYSIRVISNFT